MTPDEKKKQIEEALKLHDDDRGEGGHSYISKPILQAARDLLRLLEEMPGELPEESAGIGMMSLGWVRGHNALRQRVIGILMGDKG